MKKIKINWKDTSFLKKKDFYITSFLSILLGIFLTDFILYITNIRLFYFYFKLMQITIGILLTFVLFFRIHSFLYPKLNNPLIIKMPTTIK